MSLHGVFGIRVLAVAIVAALAISCMPRLLDEPVVENVTAQDVDDFVQVGMISTVIYWNPLNIQMVEDYIVTYMIYSSLFTYDQDWGGPVNDLATGYYYDIHANESMTVYINITTNAYFRDNSNPGSTDMPLDARDVSYTYNLIKNNSGGTFDWYLEELSYFTAHYNATSDKWDQVSTWCSYQKATLLDDISSTPILPRHIWGPEGENYEADALGGMDPEQQVGSGPFLFHSWSRDSWYAFEQAPNYHGEEDYGSARTVDIPGVLFKVVADAQAMCIEINSGVIDCAVLTGELNAFENVLGEDASVNVYKAAVAENGITDIAINAIPDWFDAGGGYLNRHEALEDPFVRKAIAMTLNRPFIVDVMMGGRPIEAHSVVQPGFWQAEIQNEIQYDPEGAKEMLEDNGWEDLDGDGWLEATADAYGVQKGMFVEGTELSGIRCQAIDTDDNYGKISQAWPGWAELAGIHLDDSIETETYMVNQAWYKADYDIWIWHWGWGPEPIGGALSVWLTTEIEKSGDNCQMPMGPWWAHTDNYTECEFIDADMIEKYDIDDPDKWDGKFSAFDQNITDAMAILDPNERKLITDKLQQWVYDSYCEIPPYYDLGLYGYSDNRFDNWGDWEAHNGLNVVSGLPWIWFMLEPVVDRKPFFNEEPDDWYTAYVGIAEGFSVQVSDQEGSPLYVNFSYGDGDTDSFYLDGDTTEPTWVNVTHVYDSADELTLNVSLTDGFKEDDVVRYVYKEATVEVQGVANAPPTIESIDFEPSSVYADEEVTLTVTAKDPDSGDSGTGLRFTTAWGDGSYSVNETATVPNDQEVTVKQTHTWSFSDDYEVVIAVWDETYSEEGEHNATVSYDFTVRLNMPPEAPTISPIFSLIDTPTECVASTSDPDLEDLKFTWDWGDGTYDVDVLTPTSEGETVESIVTHTWSTEGLHALTVWVEDEEGHNVSSDAFADISASGNVAPSSPLLDWYPDPIYIDQETTFNVSAVDANGDQITLTVDLGDGNSSTDTTEGGTTERQYLEFLHTYESAGEYTVNVTAEDAELSTYTVYTLTVEDNSEPVLIIQESYQPFWSEPWTIRPVEVSDSDVGDVVTVWYDWGDETPMTEGDPDDGYAGTHTYMAAEDYTLTVYADDGKPGHNVSKTASVSVEQRNYQAVIEDIEISPDKDEYSTDETITVILTVSDLEGDNVTISIDFGDGNTDQVVMDLEKAVDTEVTFEHAYSSSGDYHIVVTADDGFDHPDPPASETVTIEVVAPGLSWALIAGIAVAVLAAIAIAAMLMKRRKKGGPEVPEGPGGMEGMAPPEESPPPP